MSLRYYQSECVGAVFDGLRARQNPLAVIPTGGGKSHVIREIARRVVENYGRRLIVLQHRKELIEQNARGVAGAGIYSAGLSREQSNEDIIFAGIQSVYKKAFQFGRRQLVIVDEAHLVADEGMFQTFLTDLRTVNPDLLVVGMTATPFRTGEGHLADGGFWTQVYEAKISSLIADGYLCALTNRPTAIEYDTSKLSVRSGEFTESSLAALFDDDVKIGAACKEILEKTADRKSVIVFCSGVNHAHHVAEQLGGDVIYGGTAPLERTAILEAFKLGQVKYLCNCDVLTTGFDAPNIDAVVLLRATMSPGLLVQMAGRGFRTCEGKNDCLILDYGNNIKRHGPLDAIDFGKRKSEAGDMEAPEKTCPGCDQKIAAGKRVCECGFIFPESELKHESESDSESKVLATPETIDVDRWTLSRHEKKETHSLRVDYHCGITTISEWVCLLHEGFAKRKAMKWWDEHYTGTESLEWWVDAFRESQPDTDIIDAAISLAFDGEVRCPSKITVIQDGKFFRVLSREFGERVEEEEELPF